MGLTKRRLYRHERAPARKKGVLAKQAPVGCPDASHEEIAMALASLAMAASLDVKVGRGGDYDSLKDEYTVVGSISGKAQDLMIEGWAVALLINQLRVWNGGRFDRRGLTKSTGTIDKRFRHR